MESKNGVLGQFAGFGGRLAKKLVVTFLRGVHTQMHVMRN